MYFFNSIPKSVLLGGFSFGDRQLYFLHVFTPISGSGLKPTILFEYHGSCLCSSKTIGVRAGGARGAAAPPNFGQLRFFGQQEKIWAKTAFKNVDMFFY